MNNSKQDQAASTASSEMLPVAGQVNANSHPQGGVEVNPDLRPPQFTL